MQTVLVGARLAASPVVCEGPAELRGVEAARLGNVRLSNANSACLFGRKTESWPLAFRRSQAQVDCMAEILRRCPNVRHIGLASGHDIPVRTVRCAAGAPA